MNNKRLISLTACLILATVAGTSSLILADTASATDTKAQQYFDKANELRKVADHDAAIVEYDKVVKLSPNSKIAQNAQYWIGQLYFKTGQLSAALSAFQKLLDEYPTSKIIPSTKLMIDRVQQAKKNESLFEAARDGDIEQVKNLIAQGADFNAKDKGGRTALHHASNKGQVDIAKLLIKRGADVNASIKNEPWTPLLDAASSGQTQVVKLLLENGAKVDEGDSYGYTPLIYALWSRDEECVKALISAGADINKLPNENDYPALFYTVWEGYERGVKILIDAGANVNAEDENGWTPLHYAINGTTQDMINLLVGTGVKIPDFHKAALEGSLTRVKQLIASGMDVDTQDKLGWTPSYWAVSTGNEEVFKYLLSQGASISVKTNKGRTILQQACKAGFKEIVKQLIAKGADVNATSNDGEHSLGDAVLNGHEEVVKLLIANGADINLNVKGKGTALDAGAWNGHSTIVDFLIAHGANVNVNATNGKPLHFAAGASIKVADKICAKIVEKLLSKGADVHAKRSRDDRTPLHEAARKGRTQTTNVLISAGADVTSKDKDGRTPLHYAARRGQHKAAEVLIAAGSDINVRDNEGHTPLWHANDRDQRDIVKLLRRHGAKE